MYEINGEYTWRPQRDRRRKKRIEEGERKSGAVTKGALRFIAMIIVPRIKNDVKQQITRRWAKYIQEEDSQVEGDITWKAVKTPRSWGGYIWFLLTEMQSMQSMPTNCKQQHKSYAQWRCLPAMAVVMGCTQA